MPLHSKSPSRSSADKSENQQQGKSTAHQPGVLQQKINASPQVQQGIALQAMMNQQERISPIQEMHESMSLAPLQSPLTKQLFHQSNAHTTNYFGADEVAQTRLMADLTAEAGLNPLEKEKMLNNYLNPIIPSIKSRLQAAAQWSDPMEQDWTDFRGNIVDDEYDDAYDNLNDLVTKVNAIQVGGGAVELTALEQTEVIDAGWNAKARAISLATEAVKDSALIKAEFGVEDDAVAGIVEVFNKIKAHLNGMAKDKFLADADGTLQASSAGAVNNGKGNAATITFTMGFKNSSASEQAATLFHEASHGTEGISALDLAYVGSWAAEGIKGNAAKQNAPSYERALLSQAHNEDADVPGPERKNLAAEDADLAHVPKIKTAMAKLDHQITQAWWYANNLRGAITDFLGTDLLPLNGQFKPAHILWYAGVYSMPVRTATSGKKKPTSADLEIAKMVVSVMSKRKNAVNAISQFEKSDAVNPLTIAGAKITINTATLGEDEVAIGKKIINVLDTNLNVPDFAKGWDKMNRLSNAKDQIEGAAAPRV